MFSTTPDWPTVQWAAVGRTMDIRFHRILRARSAPAAVPIESVVRLIVLSVGRMLDFRLDNRAKFEWLNFPGTISRDVFGRRPFLTSAVWASPVKLTS